MLPMEELQKVPQSFLPNPKALLNKKSRTATDLSQGGQV